MIRKKHPMLYPAFWLTIQTLLLATSWVNGQSTAVSDINLNINPIALMDIETDIPVASLGITPPDEAGLPITTDPSAAVVWINYTSAIAQNGSSRAIYAQMETGNPNGAGINLTANTSGCQGGCKGDYGSGSGQVTLTQNPALVITGIGGAYTGNGTKKGHKISYSMIITDYAALKHGNTQITITYTITDSL